MTKNDVLRAKPAEVVEALTDPLFPDESTIWIESPEGAVRWSPKIGGPRHDWRSDYSRIPELTMSGLKRYKEVGQPPGHFLTAVIENDLLGAVGRADDDNARALIQIVLYVHNRLEVPHGYKGAVKEHCDRLRKERGGD